jgi:hypothetical protein
MNIGLIANFTMPEIKTHSNVTDQGVTANRVP